MENASKALLIAAAVLIAILLVTFGIKILSSSQDVSKESEKVGSTISSSSKDAVNILQSAIGTAKWTQNETVVAKGSLKLEVGDEIEYDLGGSKWRILGVENGNLLILSDEKISKPVQLSQQNGFEIEKLDNACKDYENGKGAVYARALKLEDIDRITGYNPTQYQGYGDKKTYTLSDGSSITLKRTYYHYCIYNYLVKGTKAYNMLCKSSYSLASIGISFSPDNASFSLREVNNGSIEGKTLYKTTGPESWFNGKLRAVVYLKPDIQLKNNSGKWVII